MKQDNGEKVNISINNTTEANTTEATLITQNNTKKNETVGHLLNNSETSDKNASKNGTEGIPDAQNDTQIDEIPSLTTEDESDTKKDVQKANQSETRDKPIVDEDRPAWIADPKTIGLLGTKGALLMVVIYLILKIRTRTRIGTTQVTVDPNQQEESTTENSATEAVPPNGPPVGNQI